METTKQDVSWEVQEPEGDVRELRLAVVCYGGVSLAIYMHGTTKELHKLVLASAALERYPDHNPFEQGTERVYWDLLDRISRGEVGPDGAGTRLRVVVDIISGTSAGGINGIFLAKALAGNRSQEALEQLWLEKGDVKVLLRGWQRLPALLRAAWIASEAARPPFRAEPVLRGDDMCRWLHQALEQMDHNQKVADIDSLVPEDHELQLYVPITDFLGYDREIPLYDPRFIRERTHRHVMEFRHGVGDNHLGAEHNHMLAFAARATSSFPGAFPPVSFSEYESAFEAEVGLASKAEEFFPLYAFARSDPQRAYFIDGGVLDNFPFQSTIDAIAAKPATTEVDRRLIYIEPDPEEGGSRLPDGRAPTLYRTIFAGYAGLPRKEPILDDLLHLAGRNEAVLRVRDVIESGFGPMRERVDEILRDLGSVQDLAEDPSGKELAEFRAEVEARALKDAGFAADTYLRLRIRSMVEGYAKAISRVRGFPLGSPQADLVAAALRRWAADDGLFEQEPDPTERARQVDALALDLGYHERRIRFLIAAVSWLYDHTGEAGFPTRLALNRAKASFYGDLSSVQAILARLTKDSGLQETVKAVFGQDEVRAALGADDLAAFVDRHREALTGARDYVRSEIVKYLPEAEANLHRNLLAFLDLCGDELRRDMLTRYVGFPFWDVLVYPIQAMSGVGERDHVEVYRISPRDVGVLVADKDEKGKELKGMSLFHFGAFFSREGRESDYLWGRLDAVERLIKLLLDVRRQPSTVASAAPALTSGGVSDEALRNECLKAFRAVLAEEAPSLGHARELVEVLRERVERMSPSVP